MIKATEKEQKEALDLLGISLMELYRLCEGFRKLTGGPTALTERIEKNIVAPMTVAALTLSPEFLDHHLPGCSYFGSSVKPPESHASPEEALAKFRVKPRKDD